MQSLITSLVSVVIPCYNAEEYIEETIDSICCQSYKNTEIIIVDDGSTDQSVQIIKKKDLDNVFVIKQSNKGVSAARNKGVKKARGEFIVFFDADDLMSYDFIEKRVNELNNDKEIGFVCGRVKSFNHSNDELYEVAFGAAGNVINEVLFYQSNINTCPSNYMYRTDTLKKFELLFNENLFSSADRFFLIEVASRNIKGKLLKTGGELLYRKHSDSMSSKITNRLLKDKLIYYRCLIKRDLIPPDIKKETLAKGFFILAGTAYKLKAYFKTITYLVISFYYSPIFLLRSFFKKILLKTK